MVINGITFSDFTHETLLHNFFDLIDHELTKRDDFVFRHCQGPLVGLGVGLVFLLKRISSVVEAALTGVGNIFAGLLFFQGSQFLRGVKQFFWTLPCKAIYLQFSPIEIPCRVMITAIQMTISPEEYVTDQRNDHKKLYEDMELMLSNNS